MVCQFSTNTTNRAKNEERTADDASRFLTSEGKAKVLEEGRQSKNGSYDRRVEAIGKRAQTCRQDGQDVVNIASSRHNEEQDYRKRKREDK